MSRCVACDETYQGNNHHCDPVKEARIEAGRAGYAGLVESDNFGRTEAQRLNYGLSRMYRPEDRDNWD